MIRELPELKVTVDRVLFAPNLEAPPDRPYPFVYFITIRNQSEQTVTLLGRKWVVEHADGSQLVIEGERIVYVIPRIGYVPRARAGFPVVGNPALTQRTLPVPRFA